MNAIERALIERGKKILLEYAREELEKYKKKLEQIPERTLLDVFNSGLLLDVNKLQRNGIEHLQNRLIRQKKSKKNE
jgi:hypothetical protein